MTFNKESLGLSFNIVQYTVLPQYINYILAHIAKNCTYTRCCCDFKLFISSPQTSEVAFIESALAALKVSFGFLHFLSTFSVQFDDWAHFVSFICLLCACLLLIWTAIVLSSHIWLIRLSNTYTDRATFSKCLYLTNRDKIKTSLIVAIGQLWWYSLII